MHAPPRQLALAITVAVFAAAPARAQTQWMDLEPGNSARLEMSSGGQETDGHGFRAAIFATGRVAVGARTWFVGEIPYAHAPTIDYSYDALGGYAYPDLRSSFGNPYLGVERATRLAGLRGELGVRLPVVDPDQTDAIAFGRASGVEHEDAFVPRTLHLRAAIGYHRAPRTRQSCGIDVRVAPVWAIVTHNPVDVFYVPEAVFYRAHHTSRVLFDYDANVRVQGPNARLAMGVAGRWAPVGSEVPDETRSIAEVTFLLELLHAPMRPGLGVRIPLDGLRQDSYDLPNRQASAYLGVSVPFGGPGASAG